MKDKMVDDNGPSDQGPCNHGPKGYRRIYSRRGDLGETSLCFGPRVGKDQKRIVACGVLDELNSWLGLIRVEIPDSDHAELLLNIQKQLFKVGAQVASFSPDKYQVDCITSEEIQALESQIDQLSSQLPNLDHFIIPGGTRAAAMLHVARAVCRRAERRIVSLVRADESVSRLLIGWINRLSDLLFVIARCENEL